MSRTATIEPTARKAAPAAGLFGAMTFRQPPPAARDVGEPSTEEFVEDYLSGTQAHPLWEQPAARDRD